LLAVVIAAFAFASKASAATPSMGTFTSTDTEIDGISLVCGFPVIATTTESGRFQVFFDQSGNPIRLQVEESGSGTFTANGLSVNQTNHQINIVDLVAGTNTQIGLLLHVSSGGTLFNERGLLIFDSNGNLTFEAGPHPSLDGDIAVLQRLCAALTP
jgi:hypothetical protein